MELKTGTGTPSDPYLIYGSSDFADFVTNVNNGTTASACYKLGSDVSASGMDAITTAFTGTFDGGMFTISRLTHPLFNTVNGGTVKNVRLSGVSISSSDESVGAIAGVAKGYSLIYNCGILPNDATFPEGIHPSVSGGSYAGGIVGTLQDDSRVINCFSYADVSASSIAAGIVGRNTVASNAAVTDGKYANLRTAVVNCMFYGNVSAATVYPVYGGTKITNAGDNAINNYNYYSVGCTFSTANGKPTDYNCSWPVQLDYLTRYEFIRSQLNSNRELCGWWVGAPSAPSSMTTAEVQAVPKDASLMAKWVLDPAVAPYPILKPFGYYPSPVNIDADASWRETANEWKGKKLGTLHVTVNAGAHGSGSTSLDIPITDMDTLHADYCYRKIQLPYYNAVFGNPDGTTWAEKYGGNYTEYAVTGWDITDPGDGTEVSLVEDWQDGYNFADRNCTDKDTKRTFAQGGYYYVPNGVTSITITAHWGKAIYLGNGDNYYDRVDFKHVDNKPGTAFTPAGTRSATLGNGKTVQTGKIATVAAGFTSGETVYDNALVLVGNHQYCTGGEDVNPSQGFTIMSADFDFDNEPDYCLDWQLGVGTTRQSICPIRFDFLPVVEIGLGLKKDGSTQYYSLGCYRPLGHFEVTETALIRFGQFEFSNKNRKIDAPIILNGGIYDQYTKGTNGNAFSGPDDPITYIIIGGNVYLPTFSPGAHVNANAAFRTRHCAVNVIGGRIDNLYLTGNYNNNVTPNTDNPHCYIDGGRIKHAAAAGKEGIDGNVTFKVNHSAIWEFYGGSTLADKRVTGNIDVTIDNSRVTKYCGGPKFGDMYDGKTVTTSATGTTFGVYYGGGNGGTSYVQYDSSDGEQKVSGFNWGTTGKLNNYSPGTYRNENTAYMADYDLTITNVSTGTNAGNAVYRSYFYAAQFSATNTGSITNTLTDCTVLTDFYGGGNLGGVIGNVESTLTGETVVRGSAYGAGYSASIPSVTIHNKDKTPPTIDVYTGIITPQEDGTSTTYTWTNEKSLGGQTLSTSSPAVTGVGGKNYFYTEKSLVNLGAVTGNVTLTVEGNTTVEGKVYDADGNVVSGEVGGIFGGGNESTVTGNTTVTLQGNADVRGSVYGGGNMADVLGNATVTMTDGSVGENVYGGGNLGTVGTFAYADAAYHASHADVPVGKPYSCTGGGLCTVAVSGGEIGPDNMQMPTDVGYVFGAGRGKVEDPEDNPDIDFIAYVNATDVTISGSAFVKGSVYGGSENGRVLSDTDVKIQGGQIGNGYDREARTGVNRPYTEEEWAEGSPLHECASWEYGSTSPSTGKTEYLPYDKYGAHNGGSTTASDGHTFYGNVFGGGSGLFPYLRHKENPGDPDEYKWLPSAGLVEGNTKVTITGGHILTSVYGGNELTNVKGDSCVVIMKGGTVGVPRTLDQIMAHPVTCYVFGAGKGDQRVHFNTWTNVENVRVHIGGTARVYGSVFGGGEDGHVLGNVKVGVYGGTIGTLGTSYVDGNVFGAGRGFGGDALTAGVVSGNVQIDIEGGTMLGSVYGGGRLASVGTHLVPEDHKYYGQLIPDGKQQVVGGEVDDVDAPAATHGYITINISGGTIGNNAEYVYPTPAQKAADGELRNTSFDFRNRLLYTKGGNVFAGSMGRLYGLDGESVLPHWAEMAMARQTMLRISGGTIKSCVYGGGELGTLTGNATVSITGGSVGTKVGEGDDAYIYGNVYGGGKGSTADPQGYGSISTAGQVGGNVLVELNNGVAGDAKGGVVHQIFGCNDMNGSPKGTVTVHVYKTQNREAERISNAPATNEAPAVTDAKVEGRYDVEAVYGGGNLAAYEPTDAENGRTHVIIDGCDYTSIRQVYGGGDAASTPATLVDINETFEIEEAFGGGNGKDKLPSGADNPGANVGFKDYSAVESVYDTKEKRQESAFTSAYTYGTGRASMNIHGGRVHRVYGGSNTKGNVREVAVTMLEDESGCPFSVDEAYGGGKSAPMDATSKLDMACIPGLKAAYGGAEDAEIDGNVELTITNGSFDRVFGGNNVSGHIRGTITVNIEETGCKPILIGQLYGGGNQAPYEAPAGEHGPTLNVRSFTSIGEVYGGGYGRSAVVTGDTYVNINVCQGKYVANATTADAVRSFTITEYETDAEGNFVLDANGDRIPHSRPVNVDMPGRAKDAIGAIGHVYGGGNAADVRGTTHVYIATKSEEVFRTPSMTEGGERETTDLERTKEVKGADVRGNVFGGGNTAKVGATDVIVGKKNM